MSGGIGSDTWPGRMLPTSIIPISPSPARPTTSNVAAAGDVIVTARLCPGLTTVPSAGLVIASRSPMGGTGFGTTTRESVRAFSLPSMRSTTRSFFLPGPTVIRYPAEIATRSVVLIAIGAAPVVHDSVTGFSVVVRAAAPVAVQRVAVAGVLRRTVAWGRTVPKAVLVFIQRVTVTREFAGMKPPRPGTPAGVSKL